MKGTDPAAGERRDERVDPTRAPDPPSPRDADEYDRDLNVRRVVWTGVYLAVGTVAVFVLTWWLYLGLVKLEVRNDPPPPPLAEERQPQPLPPEPRLQAAPDQDMVALREREDRILHEPAWIDRQAGIVRLPIDLALDVVARRGLPAVGAGAPSPSGRAPDAAPAAPAGPTVPTVPAAAGIPPAGGGPS